MEYTKQNWKKTLLVLFFLLPALLIYSFVVIYPIFQSVPYSLREHWDWQQGNETTIGFDNFRTMFSEDGFPSVAGDVNPFPRSILNSFVLVFLSVGIQLPLALFFALLLARGVRGEKMFRTVYFIPVILSAVVVGLLWQNIYRTDAYASGNIGVLNGLLMSLGIIDNQRQWLVDANTALICSMIPIVWQYIGQHMLLMYAGAKSVPNELYEAAMIDGATPWQVDTRITIPMMKPILQVSVIWAVTGSLKAFDQLYALMGINAIDDPNKTVPTLLMYREILFFNFGYSSAIALFIVAECLLLTFLIRQIFKERNEARGGIRA